MMSTLEKQVVPREVTLKSIPWDRIVQWGIVVLTGLLVLFPAWPILYQAFMDKPLYEQDKVATFGNFGDILGSGEFWTSLRTTIIYAIFSTILGVTLGTFLAIILSRTDIPCRKLFTSLVLIPFFVSPLVLAVSWNLIFGPQGYFTIVVRNLGLPTWDLSSLPGMIVVTGMYTAPFTYLYCISSLSLSDSSLEDAARIAGANPFTTLWKITLPLLRPAISFSALFTVVSVIESTSIPLILGLPAGVEVLSTYLYKLGVVGINKDYGSVAVVSILLIILVSGLVMLQRKLVSQERRFVTVGGKAGRPKLIRLGRFRWLTFALVSLYVGIGIILPLIGVIAQSWSPFLSPMVNPLTTLTTQNYNTVLSVPAYQSSIINSLLISTFGAAIGILFMGMIAVIAYRSDFRGRKALSYLAMFPRAFPGMIIGVGFLWAFLLIPGIGGMRNTILALTFAFIVRYLPLGFSNISPAILRISNELDRAGRVAGMNWIGVVRHILLPILGPALLSGYMLLFISFLKEYNVALFLFSRGSEVMGTTMLQLTQQGTAGPVAALATIQLLITVVVVFIASRFLGVKFHE
jgi:iron(III) transport system permease protein